MKALVFHGIGDIRLDNVPDPKIQEPTDAIVRITASAICGTDLHMVRGSMPGMKKGTILGHEGVGVVEEVGEYVRNIKKGDRVVIPSTIACGTCSYCRKGYFAQCDHANPNGSRAGTAFFGGPESSGPFDGLQAEKARIPYANVGLVRIPDNVTDEQALMLSDIFPTAYFGADMADIGPGKTVAVFGCGPVGQFAILSAFMMGAGRVIAVDGIESRLEKAREQGAEIVNFNKEDPVEMILKMTRGIGVDRVIDAVGVDAEMPAKGPALKNIDKERFEREVREIVPESNIKNKNWKPGNAPSLVSEWAIQSCAKAGIISIIGVYPGNVRFYPIGQAMQKNLTIRAGNCNHRKYIPHLLHMVKTGEIDPVKILTKVGPITFIEDAYENFDVQKTGWLKVELKPTRELAGV